MQIIPAINADTFEEAEMQLEKIALIFKREKEPWIHLDVVDGKFAGTITWGFPEGFKTLFADGQALIPNLQCEIHLMMEHPEEVIEEWFKAGAARVIVHAEAVTAPDRISEKCNTHGATAMIAIAPKTPVERLVPYVGDFKNFQLLAVKPGFAGQEFQMSVLEKIAFLRKKTSGIIEVDGGINPATAKLCKAAGADILVSASYISGSRDPRKAYEELLQATS